MDQTKPIFLEQLSRYILTSHTSSYIIVYLCQVKRQIDFSEALASDENQA